MFERIEINLEKMIFCGAVLTWHGKSNILITYDEIQNKTYCYYSNDISPWYEDLKDPNKKYYLDQNNFILQVIFIF